jgi:hypothetical protein
LDAKTIKEPLPRGNEGATEWNQLLWVRAFLDERKDLHSKIS